ncbi:MAG: pyroglutamyl-peptidase I [Hyphomicrobiaceae bacterium]
MTMRVLLTGFGPFPGVPENASARLVEDVAAELRTRATPAHVHVAILPTEWDAGLARIDMLWDAIAPDLALHFGVSASARGLTLERLARNACAPLEDACGCLPSTAHVSADAPDLHRTELPLSRIEARLLAAGIPAELSDDAGLYLCNGVLFRSLCRSFATPGPRLAGFVHIPDGLAGSLTPQQRHGDPVRRTACASALSWAQAISGACIIVDEALSALPLGKLKADNFAKG